MLAAVIVAGISSHAAIASEASACFFDCVTPDADGPSAPPPFCKTAQMEEAEKVITRVKEARDFISLVQSPTGIVLKLVNDHVVTIPWWVTYLTDPKGAIRSEVIRITRAELKAAAGLDRACAPKSDKAPEEAGVGAA